MKIFINITRFYSIFGVIPVWATSEYPALQIVLFSLQVLCSGIFVGCALTEWIRMGRYGEDIT